MKTLNAIVLALLASACNEVSQPQVQTASTAASTSSTAQPTQTFTIAAASMVVKDVSGNVVAYVLSFGPTSMLMTPQGKIQIVDSWTGQFMNLANTSSVVYATSDCSGTKYLINGAPNQQVMIGTEYYEVGERVSTSTTPISSYVDSSGSCNSNVGAFLATNMNALNAISSLEDYSNLAPLTLVIQ